MRVARKGERNTAGTGAGVHDGPPRGCVALLGGGVASGGGRAKREATE
eukprot:SAG11_NODE_27505_length_332_cov_0.592275_1_plen_47_part_10